MKMRPWALLAMTTLDTNTTLTKQDQLLFFSFSSFSQFPAARGVTCEKVIPADRGFTSMRFPRKYTETYLHDLSHPPQLKGHNINKFCLSLRERSIMFDVTHVGEFDKFFFTFQPESHVECQDMASWVFTPIFISILGTLLFLRIVDCQGSGFSCYLYKPHWKLWIHTLGKQHFRRLFYSL